MAIDIKYLPSYTVLSVRFTVPRDEHIFLSADYASACSAITTFTKTSKLSLSAHAGLHGLSILHRDWSQPKEEAVIVDECIILPTKAIDLNTCSSLVAGFKSTHPTSLTSTPAGTYAVFPYKGAYNGLPDFYKDIFGDKLPKSGIHYAGGPVLELYINDQATAAETEKELEICVPVTFGRGAGMASVPL